MQDLIPAGVVSLRLPTPYPVGPVNCYLVQGQLPTLVDTGPPTEDAWAALVRFLEEQGLGTGRSWQVVITHAHPDHFGLGERLRSRFGVRMLAPRTASRWLAPGRAEEWEEFLAGFLPRAGVPGEVFRQLKKTRFGLADFQVESGPDGWLEPQTTVRMGDAEWEVVSLPGHSSCSTAFWRREDGTCLGGDALLLDAYGHSLIEPAPAGEGWYRSLTRQMESLERIRQLGVERVLPGHGEPVAAPASFAASRLRYLRGRTEAVGGLLMEGEKTPYQVCLNLYPHLSWVELMSGLWEVMGYLDLLEERGEAAKEEIGGKLYYRAL
ncbi:MAG: MBL fold metallo-hydrolase [Bacillota bacterium]|nr:MBL fold metallo-hydrolase [Bacillota bacterium]